VGAHAGEAVTTDFAGRQEVDPFFNESLILIAGIFILSVIAGLMEGAAVALTILWVPLVVYALFLAPVNVTARCLLTAGLFIEPPDMVPGSGYWVSPLDPVNQTLYGSLKNLTGLPGLSIPFAFVCALVLYARARKVPRTDDNPRPPVPAVRSLRYFLIALAAIEAFGIVRGGAVGPSFFQILHLTTRPIMAMAFLYAIRGEEDVRAYGTIIVVVACCRALLVAWVYFVICLPQGITPEYATTHGDSVIFDAAVLVVVASHIAVRTPRSFWRMVLVTIYMLAAITMNNRRLAFVGMCGGIVGMLVWLPPSPIKKRVTRATFYLVPLLIAYVLYGANQKGPLYTPARLVLSVLAQEDTSSDSRNIENDNLIATLRDHPFTGSGFGWEYKEVVRIYDISEFFPLYRYIAHNSVLWLITIGGAVGFFFLWRTYAVATFFAARGYLLSLSANDRAGALAGIGIVIVCMCADWGDQGLVSYPSLMVFSAVFAVASSVAARAERALAGAMGVRYVAFRA
jgi:O-Antigen ligase